MIISSSFGGATSAAVLTKKLEHAESIEFDTKSAGWPADAEAADASLFATSFPYPSK